MSFDSNNYICIWSGKGTDHLCTQATLASITTIVPSGLKNKVILVDDDSKMLSNQTLARGNTLVFPGGSGVAMYETFKGGLYKIREFIQENRGSYLGICAGAYLGSPYEYCPDGEWTHTLDNSNVLRFTSSYLQGPLLEYYPPTLKDKVKQWVPITSEEARVVPISMGSSAPFHVICYCGGKYPKIGSDETALAHYRAPQTLAHTTDVAVLKPRRNVVLCNVHPEFAHFPIAKEFPHLTAQELELLKKSGDNQQQLMTCMLQNLGVQLEEPAQETTTLVTKTAPPTVPFSYLKNKSISVTSTSLTATINALALSTFNAKK